MINKKEKIKNEKVFLLYLLLTYIHRFLLLLFQVVFLFKVFQYIYTKMESFHIFLSEYHLLDQLVIFYKNF